MRNAIALATAIVVLSGIRCEAEAVPSRRMTLADAGREISLLEDAIAPDGKRVALVISRQDFLENRNVRSLLLVEASSGLSRELTFGRSSISSPRWSPSGDRLAWLESSRDGKSQISMLRVSDPGVAPSTRTEASEGVSAFRWSPDGSTFAFLTADVAEARIGEERHNKSFEVGDADYLARSAAMPSHIWLLDADGGKPSRLTSGSESITSIEWFAGGREVAYVAQPAAHASRFADAFLGAIDIETRTRRVLVPAPSAGANAAVSELLSASLDGGLLAFSRAVGPEPLFRPQAVFALAGKGSEGRNIAPMLDLNFGGAAWVENGKAMVLAANSGTRASLWLQSLEGQPRLLTLGAVTQLQLGTLSASQTGSLAFVGSEARRAPELYIKTALGAAPKRLTRFNETLTALDLGRVRTVSWKLDDFEEDGILTYPPGFQEHRRYPIVLHLRGGPMGATTEGFSTFDQLLAAQGWLVFRPNYRGSDHRGDRYQSAILGDPGDGPARDIMAGLETVKRLDIVDESRMAVSGWSYGGYLSAWLIAHYPVWRASVVGAAITDWIDQYDLSDLNRFFGVGLEGSPWRRGGMDFYAQQSPLSYADRIVTPTMILANTGDRRVPVTQSYKLYRALRDNAVPVRFVAYPLEGHWPADPVHQRDMYRRWIGWIEEHFESALDGKPRQ